MTKDEAVSRLMYTSRGILLQMCQDVWTHCVKPVHSLAEPIHMTDYTQSQLVNWWITFFEWNEETSTWEDSSVTATIH